MTIVLGAKLTVTVATGMTVTVTPIEPTLPSLVAVIVAVPAFTPLTSPETASTDAMVASELLHAIVRPVRTFPLASLVVAVACVVAPTTMLDEVILTETVATGAGGGVGGGVLPLVTVMLAVPLLPSEVPVMVAEPAPAPVMSPVAPSTVTTVGFDVDQTRARPVSTLPLASRATAVA